MAPQRRGGDQINALLVVGPVAEVDALDVGEDHEGGGLKGRGQQRGREVLVDYRVNSVERSCLACYHRDPAASAGDHDHPCLEQH